MKVDGHKICTRCGNLVPDYVAYQTGGICFDPCFISKEGERLKQLEIAARGNVFVFPHITKSKAERQRRRRMERTHQKPGKEKARQKALRRLAHLFPDVFYLLYMIERHNYGVELAVTDVETQLQLALEKYEAIIAYHSAADRSEDGIA